MTLSSPTPSMNASMRTLLANFGAKMRQIHRLTSKISLLSQKMGTKPSLWLKLDSWIVQLGYLKKQEQDALSRIKAVEDQHKKLRLKKQLKIARTIKSEFDAPQPDAVSRRRRNLWAWLFLLYVMMRTNKRASFPTLTNG